MDQQLKNKLIKNLIDQVDLWETINLLEEHGWLKDGTLHGLNLTSVDFSLCNLSQTSLERTNLQGSNLLEVDLTGANLRFANLRGCNLRGAQACEVNFEGANLDEIDARGACIGGNLYSASINQANLEKAIVGGDLRLASFRGTNLTQVKFIDGDLRGTNLRDSILISATFNNVQFDESTILPNGRNWESPKSLTLFI